APRPQFARDGERGKHVAPAAAAGHDKNVCQRQPSFSLTLDSIPREASVLNSELPPKLIMGSGNPLVGAISRTTLMLMNACTTTEIVTPSAKYFPKSSRASR